MWGRVALHGEILPGKQGCVFQWRRQFFNHCCFPGLEGSGIVRHCHASNDLCGTDQMMYSQDRKNKNKWSRKSREDSHTHTHTHTQVRLWEEAPMSWWWYTSTGSWIFLPSVVCFQTQEQRRSLGVQLQRLGHKNAMVSGLFYLSLGSVTVGKYSHQKPILERGKKGFLTLASEEMRSPANGHMGERS